MNDGLRVLHITNWYPNHWNTYEGIFVKEQFDAFCSVTSAQLVNVQVREGKSLFSLKHFRYNEREEAYFILTSITRFRIIELLTSLLLLYVLYKKRANKFNILHVHVAYPLLLYYKLWKRFLKIPVVISEHWTAYHYNFNLIKGSKGHNRIRSIFSNGLPLITVSRALQKDIVLFAERNDFKKYVLPNIIDLNVFRFLNVSEKDENPDKLFSFFVINLWRSLKNPFPLLEAFKELLPHYKLNLLIGGYGELLPEMEKFVKVQSLQNSITFLGKMSKEQIAETLSGVDAYLFSSNYETFSVACAQALCCGVPLIGPSIDAIREYAGEEDGIFIEQNTKEEWLKGIADFIVRSQFFNKENIAKRATNRFSLSAFKKDYLSIMEDVVASEQ